MSTMLATVTETRDADDDITGGTIAVDECRDGAVIGTPWVHKMRQDEAQEREWDAILAEAGWVVLDDWTDHGGWWTARVGRVSSDDEPTERPTRYASFQDAKEQGVLYALSGSEGDFDADAITREAFAWTIDTDERGNELLDTAGFEQTVTDDEFWVIVERHAR